MTGMENRDGNFIGYEYKEILVDAGKLSVYLDGYRNFGWEADENQGLHKESGRIAGNGRDAGKAALRLKRDRKIMNKAELTRLQRNFEDCMKQIEMLERSKVSKATITAIAIGVVGTIFMTGSTFAVTASSPIIWLCVLLAIPGFAGWILPYFVYKTIVRKRTETVMPLIEDKYDEIYEICEKGNHLFTLMR